MIPGALWTTVFIARADILAAEIVCALSAGGKGRPDRAPCSYPIGR